MNEVFRLAENSRIITRNNLSYIGPAIWNRIPEILKKTKNMNTFKHKMKHYYLKYWWI